MTAQENSTVSNPIRLVKKLRSGGQVGDREAGYKVFQNQIPGTVVQDVTGTYYKCSRWKTTKGEPVWAQVGNGGQNQQNYSIYTHLYGTGGGSSYLASVGKKYTSQRTVNQVRDLAYENFVGNTTRNFFIKLSQKEVEKIISEKNYSIANFFDTKNESAVDIISTFGGTPYKYMSVDSNGKSGSGGQSSMNETETMAAYGAYYAGGTLGSGSGTSSGTASRTNSTTGGKTTRADSSKAVPKSTTKIILKDDAKFYSGSNDFSLPYMKQIINNFDASQSSRQRIERIHVFEMIPNSFEFSQLSSQWNEVTRSGNYPLVDWSNYNLTKVSFRFLVVAKKLEQNQFFKTDPTTGTKTLLKQTSSVVNDGLLVSIDEQLDNIRAMVGAPSPITLYNLNTLLSTEYRYPYTNNTRNIQWIINDSSITATRLTADGRAVAAAEVSITLTEYPIIAREIIPLPPLRPDNPPPPPCKPDSGDPKCTPVVPELGLWVENTYKYAYLARDVLNTPPSKGE